MAHRIGQGVTAGGRRRWRRAAQWTAGAAAVALLTAACGGSSGGKSAGAPVGDGKTASTGTSGGASGGANGGANPASPSSSTALPLALSTSPADGAAGVDPAKGIQINAVNGKLESVTATDAAGKTVSGALAADGSSWASSGTLAISSTYTVVAKAQDGSGAEKTTTSKFTTLTPGKRLGLDHYVPDNGTTVGVGQPVAVFFTNAPNEKDRAAVEKAMTVTTTPHVDGAWNWRGDTEADWRPQGYWQPGTKVQVHLGLNGVKAGQTTYGSFTKDFSFTVGDSVISTVDLVKDKMTVTKNGQVLRTIPVSAGEVPKHPTWSGKMVILDKFPKLQMTSASVNFTDASDFYDLPVQYAVKITDSGTFLHAAPWNDGKFGHVNSSHGCIGMSLDDAAWFYNTVKPGDVVDVQQSANTKPNVTTNSMPGFDDWNLSWSDWLKGSAAGVQAAQ
ncbi:lipoprotein-anchoring transpeptidase ErfK/SrfK [Catenulispora sp. GAS73]|uniref:L,D-transpeptidase n=1 Tax=Catenulispora sp. GAS73 TaxID=3156269 RepID=UPI003514AA03